MFGREAVSYTHLFQYWRNVGDDDVINCMKLLTFVPIEEIESMESLSGAELNPVKERLAFELTKMVHGEEEAQKALETARQVFSSAASSDDMPLSLIHIFGASPVTEEALYFSNLREKREKRAFERGC